MTFLAALAMPRSASSTAFATDAWNGGWQNPLPAPLRTRPHDHGRRCSACRRRRRARPSTAAIDDVPMMPVRRSPMAHAAATRQRTAQAEGERAGDHHGRDPGGGVAELGVEQERRQHEAAHVGGLHEELGDDRDREVALAEHLERQQRARRLRARPRRTSPGARGPAAKPPTTTGLVQPRRWPWFSADEQRRRRRARAAAAPGEVEARGSRAAASRAARVGRRARRGCRRRPGSGTAVASRSRSISGPPMTRPIVGAPGRHERPPAHRPDALLPTRTPS